MNGVRTELPDTLLLVEDNPADASLLLELLAGVDPAVEVIHVGTGERALALLLGRDPEHQPVKPAVVLLDLKLPGRSGLEVLTAIRTTEPLRRLPVVVLSTSGAHRDVDACYEAGANVYLVKSGDPDRMADRLQAVVRLFCLEASLPTPPATDSGSALRPE
jgi:CheY-like chemotaxis protein